MYSSVKPLRGTHLLYQIKVDFFSFFLISRESENQIKKFDSLVASSPQNTVHVYISYLTPVACNTEDHYNLWTKL